MILTTECLITDVPEKEKPARHAPRRRDGLLNHDFRNPVSSRNRVS